MTFIDLFSGIGGFRGGMELAGHKCIGFCEYDAFARASYISMHLITDEQRERLSAMDINRRKKEILKDEYINGEWHADDIRHVDAANIPKADCWCFGAPCQSFSVAGKRAGLDGESGLIREVFRILREIREEDRPEWLIYENVKGMFSSNRGFDYLAILLEMDELGFDCEWQLFNSKYFGVPHNRERVYTLGHSRRFGPAKIFPLQGAGGEDSVEGVVIQTGQIFGTEKESNPSGGRVYGEKGIMRTLGAGHGMSQPYISVEIDGLFNGSRNGYGDNRYNRILCTDGISTTLTATDYKDPTKVTVRFAIDKGVHPEERDVANTLTAREDRGLSARKQEGTAVCIPVLTPDRINKKQNGRRFKEDGDPAFTLTAQDRHGAAVGVPLLEWWVADGEKGKEHPGIYVQLAEDCTVYATWYKKYGCYVAVRKLTPRECFRLQGWTDDYFEKAAFVNLDSQLYKQAGNGVTVNVVYEIAKRIKRGTNDRR